VRSRAAGFKPVKTRIFTGTPAAVGLVVIGNVIGATVAGLEPLIITIG